MHFLTLILRVTLIGSTDWSSSIVEGAHIKVLKVLNKLGTLASIKEINVKILTSYFISFYYYLKGKMFVNCKPNPIFPLFFVNT